MGHKGEPAIHDASVAGVVKGEHIPGLRFLSDLVEGRHYSLFKSILYAAFHVHSGEDPYLYFIKFRLPVYLTRSTPGGLSLTSAIVIDPFIGTLMDNWLANAESSGTVVRYVVRS